MGSRRSPKSQSSLSIEREDAPANNQGKNHSNKTKRPSVSCFTSYVSDKQRFLSQLKLLLHVQCKESYSRASRSGKKPLQEEQLANIFLTGTQKFIKRLKNDSALCLGSFRHHQYPIRLRFQHTSPLP
ncbi:hypothetical protein ACU8KH_00287 [Lachancea thermotolerans]